MLLFVQEEDERRAKEERERREEEEYLKLKASFVVEDQGEEEQLTEDQVPVSAELAAFEHFISLSFGQFLKLTRFLSPPLVSQPSARIHPVH